MRNPRRDAAEYAILLALGASVTVGIGIMLTTDFRHDTETGKESKIDFRHAKPVNLQDAMKELRQLKYRGIGDFRGKQRGGDGEGGQPPSLNNNNNGSDGN
mmetsp:Transcript_20384/g.31463  ORF Transcript_20384/g.31463 Transcript_20384/m.31463 type:complete len:101 (+) Transcript_20384:275-577(+)